MSLLNWHEWKDLLRHYTITTGETIRLIILSICFGLIIAFASIATAETLEDQVSTLLLGIIIALMGVFIHDAAHRISALKRRMQPESGINYYWLCASLAAMILSKGTLTLFFGERMTARPMRVHRLGHFSYHEGTDDLGAVALAGPLASIALALAAFILNTATGGSILLEGIIRFSTMYALVTFLPLPGLDGLMAFFSGRLLYAFIFGCVLGYFIFIQSGIGIIGTTILALMVGAIVWYIFYNFWENP